MKGINKIEFSGVKDESKLLKSYFQNEQNIIPEEPSPLATSKSSSSKPSLSTPTSLLAPDTQRELKEKVALEDYNQGIEVLYISILEWMLNRSTSNLNEPLMIDDSDEINNSNVLIILFNLIKNSNDILKQKALQDFQMLAKLNKTNCAHIIENKFFHPWILDLLLPYQITLANDSLNGSAMVVYDIGSKLHTLVLLYSLQNEPKNRFIHYLARWPLILSDNEKSDANITKIKESSNQLTKHLISSLIKSVAIEASKCRPSLDQIIWCNVARLVFVVEELVLNGKPTNIIFKEGIKSIYEDYLPVLNRIMIKSSENRKETVHSISMLDTCIIDDIFKALNFLWPSSLFETGEVSKTKEGKILDILSRISDDDFAKDAELLMYGEQKEKKASSNEPSKNLLRCIVNLACLKISTVRNEKVLGVWLNILLRMSKYLLLTSETWTTKDSSFYKSTQNSIAESLTFIIVFLNREIICSNIKENSKALTHCLEEIMIHFLITVNYSDIKYTPQQLKQTNHKTASKELMNTIFIVDEESPLITQKIIEKLKISDYKNISKVLFQTDRWRNLINDSQRLEEIVESHISFDLLEVIEKRKRIYAKNTQQIEISAERAKNDKATKIHTEIMDVAMTVSEQSFEVKNKSLIKNEQLKRSYKHEWRNISNDLVLWKG